ncbi:helix-turn-helix domain containing protein [Oscillatoria sp. CS-180]|uniref:TetR/AcrR family transcriptional regulator n=1 Tax=Oscillatoria sp. CS-180 TaxID=3021720 RepID=UPI00232AE077|nr:TetR/AcrR family transcriptional regulator [Oscillatoria sp. CS-180]MDB9524830.1 helix-turn-helix domain containing protein [Oscillatoria sp. CS-180]
MPKLSEQAMQARRDQILEAAIRCFCRLGYQGTTMRDIFAESELSAGAVYNYFQSKEEIIQAVAERNRTADRDTIAPEDLTSESAVAALPRLIDLYFGSLEAERQTGFARMEVSLLNEAAFQGNVAATLKTNRAEVRKSLTQFVRHYLAGAMPDADVNPDHFAELMFAVHQGLMLTAALNEEVDILAVAALLPQIRFT